MYTFKSRVRYTEINHQWGIMTPSSIINYFQDCSTFQSEDMNVGLSYLKEKHRVWLLNSWQLELIHPISLGDMITIATWPYGFKGFYGYRNFMLKNDQEEVLAVANSTWVYIDTLTGTPARVPDDNAGYVLEPPYPMEYLDRKVPVPDEATPFPAFPVIKSHIDSYNHVNNGQYIKMAEEYLPKDFRIKQLRVEYRHQAVLGDTIYPSIRQKDHEFYVILADSNQKPYSILQFTEGF